MSKKAGLYYITVRYTDRTDITRAFTDVFRLSAYDRNHAVRLARCNVNGRKYSVQNVSAVRVG